MQSILTSDPRHPSGPIGPIGPNSGKDNNNILCTLCRDPNFCGAMAPVCAKTQDPQKCLQEQAASCKASCGVDIQCLAPLIPLSPAPKPPPIPPQIPVLPSPSIPLRPSNIAPPQPPDIHPIAPPLMPLRPVSPLKPVTPPQKNPNPSMMRTLLEDLGIFVAVALLLYFLYQAMMSQRIQELGVVYY